MHKLALIMGLLLYCVIPRAAHAQGAPPVQTCDSGGFSSATSTTCTFSGNTTIGHSVMISVNLESTTVTVTSASCYLNTMAATTNSPTKGTGAEVYIFYTYSSVQCQTVTVNFSGPVTGGVLGAEYTGAPSSGALDIDCGSSGNGTSLSSGSCTTSNASDLLFGAGISLNNAATFTAGASYTVEAQASHSSQGNSVLIEDRNVNATGSNSATATASGSAANWVMMMAAFKVAPPAPTIGPLNPIVSTGGTQTFSCSANCGTGGAWSIASGSGSINSSTGVYTPPATIAAHQSVAGFQLLPNDHIFNTDISGLSAASNSATVMAGLGSTAINFLPAYPINYVNNATHTESMVFYYTPANNGTFTVAQWPDANIENGWFDARLDNTAADHHMINCNTVTGECNEMYQYYPIGIDATCPTCNSQSGVKYEYSDYALPTNPTTNAGGTYIEPLTLKSQEFVNAVIAGGAITHALQMTLTNSHICASSLANVCVIGATGNLAGTRHIWPATQEAYSGGGTVPYGACFRLKAAYDISGFSAAAQIVLTTLKHYCAFVTDGGFDFQISVDYDNMPQTETAALKEINAAGIVGSSNMEVVDVGTALEESFSSGSVNNGEIVSFTSSFGTATTHVNLQGATMNVKTNQDYVMAGTPQYQLVGYSSGAFTCSMSPTVGSLTSDCKYTAPASVTVGTMSTTTVTFTSSVNSAVTAKTIINVFPATNFNLIQDTADFTDSGGKKWFAGSGYGFGLSNAPQWQGCCQNNASITGTDKQLQWNHFFSSFTNGDLKMDFHVPNGVYTATFNNGTTLASGADVRYFYAQGSLISTVDSTVSAGGVNKFWTYSPSIIVLSGVLSFYNAGIGKQTNNTGDVSSISLVQSSNLSGSILPAGVKITGVSVQ